MKPMISQERQSIAAQLLDFLLLALRLTPKLLWWLLATLVFALLNLALKDEVWPNTARAKDFFVVVAVSCFVLLPWLLSVLAWRVANSINCSPWDTLVRAFAVIGFLGATCLSLIVLILVLNA
ncbi:hypothetical protein GCM10011383_02850 [Hymenobacter cavernae]|uniref:Uncharacterized protein n=1 Tax=Hymenobacter cavernae TaxID=2044852 RepID=A0ABQ1TJR0_9BACT|nr:hypothetical protein GCM10011383_02850 [Hymenobacter cavernae]